jgi:hypothetical protein
MLYLFLNFNALFPSFFLLKPHIGTLWYAYQYLPACNIWKRPVSENSKETWKKKF